MAVKLARLTGHPTDYWLRASFAGTASSTSAPANAQQHSRPPGLLINRQIIQIIQDRVIKIDPFDKTNVHTASLDLTLDDVVLTTGGKKIDISDKRGFTLKRGESVSASTRERVEYPMNYVGRVGTGKVAAQRGIITSHGFQIEPGFKGNLQFWVFNPGGSSYTLRSGDPIISIEIVALGAGP
jgi:deoxycytidine triphosphate deaminase